MTVITDSGVIECRCFKIKDTVYEIRGSVSTGRGVLDCVDEVLNTSTGIRKYIERESLLKTLKEHNAVPCEINFIK